MNYVHKYHSPLGKLFLISDGEFLTGLYFEGERLPESRYSERKLPIFAETSRWLDLYFAGNIPNFTPPVKLAGSEFQRAVWERLVQIPYGQTTTYGEIADSIARERGISKMSAQAVGGAVGKNPVSIIVPCHRVVGKNGALVGYAGGLDKKIKLLEIEKTFFEEKTYANKQSDNA